jgi:hypothetical protein
LRNSEISSRTKGTMHHPPNKMNLYIHDLVILSYCLFHIVFYLQVREPVLPHGLVISLT